jgi:hypothetical protein
MPAPPHSSGTTMPSAPSSPSSLQRLGREGVVAVPFGGEGGQALLREIAHGVADHFLFLGQDHAVFSRVF